MDDMMMVVKDNDGGVTGVSIRDWIPVCLLGACVCPCFLVLSLIDHGPLA